MSFQVFKNFFIYSVGAAVLRIITGLVTFISISFLSPAEFGLLGLVNTFLNVCPIFLNLGLRQVYSIDFFHVNISDRKKMIREIVIIYLTLSIPILCFLFGNLSIINDLVFLGKLNNSLLIIIFFICFMHFFTELFFQTLRYIGQASKLTIIQILMSLVYLGSAIFFVYFIRLKIFGVIISNLISMTFVYVIGLYLYIKKIGFQFDFKTNKKRYIYYLKHGFPFIPSILFNWIMSFSDRWILLRYVSLHDVGIYSFADSFGQLYQAFILYPLTGSYMPYIFKKFSENKNNMQESNKWNYKNMWLSMIIMFFLVTIVYFFCKKFFYMIFPSQYYESINLIWLILIEQIIFMGSYFANFYLQFLKRTYIFSGLIVCSALINILLNFTLIPFFSIYGSVFATIISYVIYLGLILVANRVISTRMPD